MWAAQIITHAKYSIPGLILCKHPKSTVREKKPKQTANIVAVALVEWISFLLLWRINWMIYKITDNLKTEDTKVKELCYARK